MDLTTSPVLLDNHLATRSYIVGDTSSQTDVNTFTAIKLAPNALEFPHAARWYKQIASYDKVDLEALPATEGSQELGLITSDSSKGATASKFGGDHLSSNEVKKTSIAKTVVTLEVKPWDDNTDMALLEAGVRGIIKEGLVWGISQFVAVGYGIKMLQINLVVEDSVSVDDLTEEIIEEVAEYAQSADIVAMQKL